MIRIKINPLAAIAGAFIKFRTEGTNCRKIKNVYHLSGIRKRKSIKLNRTATVTSSARIILILLNTGDFMNTEL